MSLLAHHAIARRPGAVPALALLALATLSCAALPAAAASLPFVNEIHYDNAGGDVGEGVEIAAAAGTDLSGWSLVLYNGSNGAVYGDAALSGLVPDQQAGFGTVFFVLEGLQNGPDGFALVGADGSVAQFLSYEGSFVATDGPAAGLASSDIGVAEAPDTPAGLSLQLAGTGAVPQDFVWNGPLAASPGAINAGQTFVAPVPLPGALPMLLGATAALCGMRRRQRAEARAQRRVTGTKVQRTSCQDNHSRTSGITTVSSRKLVMSVTT